MTPNRLTLTTWKNAKYFGALFFYVILWIPTALYFVIFQAITHKPAAGSTGAYLGGYLMILLLGMFYLSIGCFASVVTKNQIVAAVISFCVWISWLTRADMSSRLEARLVSCVVRLAVWSGSR